MPKAIAGAHDAILEAARRLLVSEGYQGLGMRAIAAECGMALGTLYHYYRAKDEIVYALMEADWKFTLAEMDRDTVSALAQKPAESTAGTLLRLFFRLSEFTRSYSEIWRTIALLPPQEKSPSVRCYDRGVFMREYGARIESALGAGSEAREGADRACLAIFIARMFSTYAMDADPDVAMLECVLSRLLGSRDSGFQTAASPAGPL